MSDFQLRTPGLRLPRATAPSLGNFQLQLNPVLAAEFRAMRAGQPTPSLRNLFLQPNWRQMRQEDLNRVLRQPPPAARAPLVPPGPVPDDPPVEVGAALLAAIWAVPTVQGAVNRLLDDVQRDFGRLSPGQTVVFATQAALILGGVATGINLQRDAPGMPLSLIVGQSIPVPGVNGLSFQILHRGGQLSLSDIGGSGVSVEGSAASVDDRFRGEITITLDLHQIIDALQ